MADKRSIAVIISGTGRSLANLVERISSGKLDCAISIVVSSKPGVQGLDVARDAGIKTIVIDRRKYKGDRDFSRHVVEAVESAKPAPELIVFAGLIHRLIVPDSWNRRVINIHPALLPKFGGKGMYGHHVHDAVLRSGDKESGCSVHYVTNELDEGEIILQKIVRIIRGDTPDTLAARVFTAECEALPEAIQSVLHSMPMNA
ncbi:MAG: phosphoribosylglycinamide formyltransferase [Planctomycetes bacterium]|nr:phosphoribosylglycinamide formyltransferase [Planctomycetota bacterium]